MTLKHLEARAMKLSAPQRAKLARSLLESLESMSDEELQALWVAEALRRNEEAESDPDVELPVERSLKEARDLIR